MDIRRLVGAGLIGLGVANILNFWAPAPVPTFGPSAFIMGGLLIGAGLLLRAPRGESGRIAWDRLFGIARLGAARPKPVDPMLAVRILKLASESGGSLSVSQAAIKLNVALDDAQAALDECAVKGTAYIQVDEATGIPAYRFPEFYKGDGPKEP